ncbi:NAD-dependent epimerase/dehydratase family protein [Ramlibacter sp. PS4R-6]|uniref:NAD-dependent epimerase/dehydratase family protein n=1 Tax=Ramlibacter sp. PS4R-6 TaxID=3133438 RepID=UPI0030B7A3D7
MGTVLLTGATGFVGRQVLRELRRRGAAVRVAVRDGSQHRLEDREGLHSVVTTPDLFGEPASWWASACAGMDTVVHAAWYAEPGQYLGSPKNIDCLAGTLRLAQGAAAAGARRIVGVGTCFEYEVSAVPLSTHAPLRPQTPYAGAKAAAFLALSQNLPPLGVSFAWCRLFYLYGEGEDPRRLVPQLRSRLQAGQPVDLTRGDQVRDYMDVADAARMIVDTTLSGVEGAVNVCSGVPVTIRALAERIAAEYGRADLLRFGARPDNPFDPPHIVGIPGQQGA